MSEVVTRLFGSPGSPFLPGGVGAGNDDFPVEQIKASVAAIVASSRQKRGTAAGPEVNAVADAGTYSEEPAWPSSLQLAEDMRPPESPSPEPVALATPQQNPVRAKTARPAPKRRLGWMAGLAAAAGMGMTAVGAFIGLDLMDTGAEGVPRTLSAGEDKSSGQRSMASPVEVPQAVTLEPAAPRPVPARHAAVLSDPVSRPVAPLPGLAGTSEAAATVTVPSPTPPPPAPVEVAYAGTAPGLAPPSIKPATQSSPGPTGTAPPSGPATPREVHPAARTGMPERVYPGPIAEASAAGLVLALVEESGATLSRSERLSLAVRIERALETELDGRVARLEAPGGKQVSLAMLASRQADQSITVARHPAIALIETGFGVQGGWFAARDDISVRPLPDVQTEMDGGAAAPGTLFERIATVTSPYGDRWFLVGQGGVAQGYVSAGDLVPLETYEGALGPTFGAASLQPVHDTLTAQTTCRAISISVAELAARPAQVCRHADGRWLEHAAPVAETPARAVPGQGSTHEILSALDLAADATSRAALAEKLDSLIKEKVEAVQLAIPLGANVIALDIRESDEQRRTISLRRAAEVAPVRSDFTIGHGWVETRIETQLRPAPSSTTRFSDGTLPVGAHMEVLGLVGEPETATWALLGRNGVAQGYVPIADLRWRDADTGLRFTAFSRAHGRVVQEEAVARTHCRVISVSGNEIETCSRTDGRLAIGLAGVPGRADPVRVAFVP